MAVGANGFVDMEAALQLSVVVDTERTGEAPALGLDGRLVICGLDRWRSFVGGKCGAERNRERNCQARGAGNAVKRQCRHSTGSGVRRRGAGCGVDGGASSGPSTDSVMLPGSAFGFSIHPTTGITTRKNRK